MQLVEPAALAGFTDQQMEIDPLGVTPEMADETLDILLTEGFVLGALKYRSPVDSLYDLILTSSTITLLCATLLYGRQHAGNILSCKFETLPFRYEGDFYYSKHRKIFISH